MSINDEESRKKLLHDYKELPKDDNMGNYCKKLKIQVKI
jgi:hypothetical protein